jgi:4-diphosphocytidyl-2-C-methyl-D-erythritol kinase
MDGLRLGRFRLTKRLPAGAGLGGGSSDAAAALRLIARANDLANDDRRIVEAARATGADVPVCLDPRARLMHGTGDILSAPLDLPVLDAVLVFPAAPLATAEVFAEHRVLAGALAYDVAEIPKERDALLAFLANEANDLERTAGALAPAIETARGLLESLEARLVRMSGSGSALFAIFDGADAAKRAAASIQEQRPDWWVAATTLR